MVRRITHFHLSKALPNSEILQFNNGLEALETLKSSRRYEDLTIVLDLEMPVMDGFMFCAELSKTSNFWSHKIIVHTSLSEDIISKRLHYDVFKVTGKMDFAGLINAIYEAQYENDSYFSNTGS